MKRRSLLLMVALLLPPMLRVAPGAQRLDEPALAAPSFKHAGPNMLLKKPSFGDATNVKLLAGLLSDEDPFVRERTVRALGQTRNREALPHVLAAQKDVDYRVRAAAVGAAAGFAPDLARGIVLRALKDKHARVLLAALRTVRQMDLSAAGDRIPSLLQGEDMVAQAALKTLTHLGAPAPPADLKALLDAKSLRVRVAAAENARLLADGSEVLAPLMSAAKSGPGALRATALAALGRLDFDGAKRLIDAAATDKSPLLRRGALLACRYGGKTDRIRPFLDDTDEMVRLAAIRAAGALKAGDCVDKLFALVADAAVDDPTTSASQPHRTDLAIRDSLLRIGNKAVQQGAGKLLRAARVDRPLAQEAIKTLSADHGKAVVRKSQAISDLKKEKGGRKRKDVLERFSARVAQSGRAEHDVLTRIQAAKKRFGRTVRNIRVCAWLLGELQSDVAFGDLVALLVALKLDDRETPIVIEALGKIGDRDPSQQLKSKLVAKMGYSYRKGLVWLREQQKMQPAYVEYSEPTAGAMITAAGRLRAPGAAPLIHKQALAIVGMRRHNYSPSVAATELARRVTPATRAEVEKTLLVLLDTPEHSGLTRFRAAVAVGRIKARDESVRAALTDLLTEQRPQIEIMTAAAWALQEITGLTPKIGDPVTNQGPNWILRTDAKSR